MFAKLYGTDTDQVLVKLDANDEGAPEVRVYFQPPDLGICSAALVWVDNDAGWNLAEAAFAKMDETKARGIVNDQLKMLEGAVDR